MANPYPEGSPLFYIAEGARIYDEMVADPRHPYHQPCERELVNPNLYECRTHGKPWGECEVKAES